MTAALGMVPAIVCKLRSMPEPLQLVGFDGKLFKLRSHKAFAPGQPLTLDAQFQSSVTLELKSIGSVKLADGIFEVRARAMTLRKEARETLLSHFPPP
ncbi:MAG: hypothetical protein JWN48_1300 [Myxococcaceae bacterium]|nr:hypothetical protein [Myxococcaceae bacterium]